MSTVSPFLKKTPDKDGRCRLYIRVNTGEKRTYLPTDIKLTVDQWSVKDGAIKKNHPHHVVLNYDLKKRVMETETALITGGRVPTKSDEITYKDYVEQLIKRWHLVKQKSTLKQFTYEISKIELYHEGIGLKQITPAFLTGYQTYMLTELGNVTNTVGKTMKSLKTVIHQALKDAIITTDPFFIYKSPKAKNGNRVALNDQELIMLEEYLNTDQRKDVQLVGWYFLLGCYSGLRFEDLRAFNPATYIQNNRLQLYTGKTGSPVSIKIGENLQRVIDKVIKLPKLYVNQKANEKIKGVMSCAGITKHISFHCSRHTFAVRCAAAGITTEVTGRLLGHTDLKTTSIYYRIVDKRVDDEMDKLG